MKAILNGKEVTGSGTVSELLRSVGINPETVLVLREKSLVPGDYMVKNGDKLETVTVISGG